VHGLKLAQRKVLEKNFMFRIKILSLPPICEIQTVDSKYFVNMTKADIVNEIAEKTGIEKMAVQATVEAFMKTIRNSMVEGKNVYLRGFGTFVVKRRAEKIGRNISKNTTVVIPAHYIPAFKASKTFAERVKKNVKSAEPLKNLED
jgi:DNA-binding protein HU-beta